MEFKRSMLGAALLGAAAFSGSAMAGVTGNVGVTSEYFYRGLLQTASTGTPSVSGGLDYAHDSGFYVGTWAAGTEGFAGGLEWDVFGGFSGEIGSFGYDIGVFFYGYPDAGVNDTIEYHIGGTVGPATLTYNYSDDWFGSDLDASYLNLALAFSLSETLDLGLSVGYSFGDAFDQVGGLPDYVDYNLSLTKKVTEQLSASLSLIGTDLDEDVGETVDAGPRLIIGATYSFDL